MVVVGNEPQVVQMGQRVILVHDDANVLAEMAAALNSSGYEVSAFASTLQALDASNLRIELTCWSPRSVSARYPAQASPFLLAANVAVACDTTALKRSGARSLNAAFGDY